MRRLLSFALFSIALLFSLTLGAKAVSAGTGDNVTGWAWSSNIGWISMNCTNDSSCGTSNYGVNKNVDNTLTGYAWSSTVGWIQFGGQAGFPSGSGTTGANVAVSGTNVTGWIRGLANGGGWDGWISMRGTSPAYGVTLSGTAMSGWAWGGDVVGWISFSCSDSGTCGTVNYGVTLSGDASLDVKSGGVSIVGSTTVPYGTVPTFEWTLTSLPGGTTCSVSKTSVGGTAFTTISGISSSSSAVGSALTDAAYTYQIECVNGSPIVTKTVSFTVLPQVASFSIGGTENMRIQFLSPATADSEQKGVFVEAFGGFNTQVDVSITGFPTPPASTTFLYSFNGGSSYSANPGTISLSSPYSSGVPFKVRVTRALGAPAFTGPFTITLRGAASGYPNATKNIILSPTSFTPVYDEI
jgi:hypothetical protein